MKKPFGLKAFSQNLVMTKTGEVWAYYRIQSEHVTNVDVVKKEELKQSVMLLLNELYPYQKIDLFMLPRDMTLSERFADLVSSVDDDLKEVASHYAERTVSALHREIGQVYVYDWVIGLPLNELEKSTQFKQTVLRQAEYFVDGVMNGLGFEVPLAENWAEEYEELEYATYVRLGGVNASRLTVEEMRYLTRLHFIRNMPHTMDGESVHESIEQITDGIMNFGDRGFVGLKSYEGESCVAFLPLANTRVDVTNIHIGELAQNFPFPIELRYQLFYERLQPLQRKVVMAQRRVENVMVEGYQAVGSIKEKDIEVKQVLNDIEGRIDKAKDKSKEVFVSWRCVLVVQGKNKREVTYRCNEVIKYFNKQGIYFVRAVADQEMLFTTSFFGQLERLNYLCQVTTTSGFAQNLVFTNGRIGTRTGWYIGRVDTRMKSYKDLRTALASSRNIVLYNPTIVNKGLTGSKTDSPHVAVTGETGKGKSYLIKLLHFYLSFTSKTLYIDPKREVRRRFFDVIQDESVQKKYPFLIQHLQQNFKFITIDVRDKRNYGVLDPIVFLKGVDAQQMASAMFKEIYNFERTALLEKALLLSIKKVVEEREAGQQVGMIHVIEKLRQYEDKEVFEVGDLLLEKVRDSILSLAFSDGVNPALSFEARNTILEVAGLDLPDSSIRPKDYTETQRYSQLIMLGVGKYIELFGTENPNEFTVSIADETWWMLATATGRKVLKSMKRVGRSFNNMLVLGTQSVLDFNDEQDHGNFGVLFAFDEPKEREEILRHLNLPVTEKNIDWLANTIKGQCLFLDNYRHCGKMSVHCVFPEIDRLFKTVDETHASRLEEQYV